MLRELSEHRIIGPKIVIRLSYNNHVWIGASAVLWSTSVCLTVCCPLLLVWQYKRYFISAGYTL